MVTLANALSKAGFGEYLARLQAWRASEDDDVKLQALYAVGNSNAPYARAALVDLAKTAEFPEVGVLAIQGLGRHGDEEPVPVLLELAGTDTSRSVRTAAVQAPGQIDSPKAREALVRILAGDQP